jgi:hypothetical protein
MYIKLKKKEKKKEKQLKAAEEKALKEAMELSKREAAEIAKKQAQSDERIQRLNKRSAINQKDGTAASTNNPDGKAATKAGGGNSGGRKGGKGLTPSARELNKAKITPGVDIPKNPPEKTVSKGTSKKGPGRPRKNVSNVSAPDSGSTVNKLTSFFNQTAKNITKKIRNNSNEKTNTTTGSKPEVGTEEIDYMEEIDRRRDNQFK